MSIDYDLFVIDANNKDTTLEQLRDCIKDALENINEQLARGAGLIPTAERMKEFDRDKFANDFEEEHGWCPDAGYEEIKSTDDKQAIKEAYEYMKRIKLNQKDITVSWDGGKTWYRDGEKIKSD